MRAGERRKKGTGSAGQALSEKVVEEERPTATSGSIMEVHWRNSCLVYVYAVKKICNLNMNVVDKQAM